VANVALSVGVLRVAIDAPLHNPFEYLPPSDLSCSSVPVGVRVRVPLGRRTTVGMVVDCVSEPSVGATTLKAVQQLIDSAPLLDERLMQLLRWTADYYHHPLGEVIAAALPKALREGAPASAMDTVWRLTPLGAVALESGSARRARIQHSVLTLLANRPGGIGVQQIAAQVPQWRAAAKALRQRGWIERLEVAAARSAVAADITAMPRTQAPSLSPEQSSAVVAIDGAAGSYQAFVLRGATGSGKTEVYLQCAQRALARGGSVLVLVPEIGLTPQLVQRFKERLHVETAVLHSGLSDAERLAAWRAAHSSQARIVLGTRLAVFAPLPDLQLIIVDEEHDSSYKQYDGGCRYSARDLAVVRAHHSAVPILLGSATPGFETLLNIQRGRYTELLLPRRADQAPAPTLALIDLRAHPARLGLSVPVMDAMRRHLAAPGQVLVFINRRGYAPTLLCTSCGWIAPCRACDARLTVHHADRQLRCHHCGHNEALPEHCLRCGHTVKAVGQGTERVEQTLREMFPSQTLVRLDRDTAAGPEELEDIMQGVASGKTRILVGTQMVTKGHHFPGVSLVVVLNADQGLFSTDYRAAERLAQTMIQVAGRAGRERDRGEVLIQTEYPDHPLLQNLLSGGYESFAAAALIEREAAGWPPYGRLALLRASSVTPEGALEFLRAVKAAAPNDSSLQNDVRILGPVPATMARRADRYYAQLLIESPQRTALHRMLSAWLPDIERLAKTRRVRFALDVDPIDIL
jgi:primosomal protein N' (replication factor Y)